MECKREVKNNYMGLRLLNKALKARIMQTKASNMKEVEA
jgi:hypothetical protein